MENCNLWNNARSRSCPLTWSQAEVVVTGEAETVFDKVKLHRPHGQLCDHDGEIEL